MATRPVDYLLVGLGNPGRDYKTTRHNGRRHGTNECTPGGLGPVHCYECRDASWIAVADLCELLLLSCLRITWILMPFPSWILVYRLSCQCDGAGSAVEYPTRLPTASELVRYTVRQLFDVLQESFKQNADAMLTSPLEHAFVSFTSSGRKRCRVFIPKGLCHGTL